MNQSDKAINQSSPRKKQSYTFSELASKRSTVSKRINKIGQGEQDCNIKDDDFLADFIGDRHLNPVFNRQVRASKNKFSPCALTPKHLEVPRKYRTEGRKLHPQDSLTPSTTDVLPEDTSPSIAIRSHLRTLMASEASTPKSFIHEVNQSSMISHLATVRGSTKIESPVYDPREPIRVQRDQRTSRFGAEVRLKEDTFSENASATKRRDGQRRGAYPKEVLLGGVGGKRSSMLCLPLPSIQEDGMVKFLSPAQNHNNEDSLKISGRGQDRTKVLDGGLTPQCDRELHNWQDMHIANNEGEEIHIKRKEAKELPKTGIYDNERQNSENHIQKTKEEVKINSKLNKKDDNTNHKKNSNNQQQRHTGPKQQDKRGSQSQPRRPIKKGAGSSRGGKKSGSVLKKLKKMKKRIDVNIFGLVLNPNSNEKNRKMFKRNLTTATGSSMEFRFLKPKFLKSVTKTLWAEDFEVDACLEGLKDRREILG